MRTTIGIIFALAIVGSIYSQDTKITSNCESPFKLYITPLSGADAINTSPKAETTYCSTEFSNTGVTVPGSCCNKEKINTFHQKNMDTLKKSMLEFTEWIFDFKTALEKTTVETALATKLTDLQKWAAAEVVKNPKKSSDTGADKDYINSFMAKDVDSYKELEKFMKFANTEGFYKATYMTEMIKVIKEKGQKCLTFWDTYLKKTFCLLCSPKVNTYFADTKLKIPDTMIKPLLLNCADVWYYTTSLTMYAKSIAFTMNAHAMKALPADYLAQTPKPNFELDDSVVALKEMLGVTTETLDAKFAKFATANGNTKFVDSFLFWNTWNPLLWGNAKDLELASAIFNTASPKPAATRLLSKAPTHAEHF